MRDARFGTDPRFGTVVFLADAKSAWREKTTWEPEVSPELFAEVESLVERSWGLDKRVVVDCALTFIHARFDEQYVERCLDVYFPGSIRPQEKIDA